MEKEDFNKKFGEFVRLKRLALQLNQPQLADRLGLDYQYISRVERGLISPTLFWITKLSTALGMSLGAFVREFAVYAGLETEATC